MHIYLNGFFLMLIIMIFTQNEGCLVLLKAIQNIVMKQKKLKSAWLKSDLRARAQSYNSAWKVLALRKPQQGGPKCY